MRVRLRNFDPSVIFVILLAFFFTSPRFLQYFPYEPLFGIYGGKTPFPEWGKLGWKSYTKKLEHFLRDGLPGRDLLYHWRGVITYRIFGAPVEAQKVKWGREGWLFYTEDYVSRSWGSQDSRSVRANLESRQRWMNEHLGKRVPQILLVPPDKSTLYADFLPPGLRELAGRRPDWVGQLRTHLQASPVPGLKFPDMLETLQRAREETAAPLFFLTDSHWNSMGAYYGYREICRALGIVCAGAVSVEESKTRAGDLARASGLLPLLSEKNFLPVLEAGRRFPDPTSMVGFPYNHGATLRTDNPHAMSPMTAYVLHDSFGLMLFPYLKALFRTTWLQWDPDISVSTLEKLRPDVVIYVIVERNLRGRMLGGPRF